MKRNRVERTGGKAAVQTHFKVKGKIDFWGRLKKTKVSTQRMVFSYLLSLRPFRLSVEHRRRKRMGFKTSSTR